MKFSKDFYIILFAACIPIFFIICQNIFGRFGLNYTFLSIISFSVSIIPLFLIIFFKENQSNQFFKLSYKLVLAIPIIMFISFYLTVAVGIIVLSFIVFDQPLLTSLISGFTWPGKFI